MYALQMIERDLLLSTMPLDMFPRPIRRIVVDYTLMTRKEHLSRYLRSAQHSFQFNVSYLKSVCITLLPRKRDGNVMIKIIDCVNMTFRSLCQTYKFETLMTSEKTRSTIWIAKDFVFQTGNCFIMEMIWEDVLTEMKNLLLGKPLSFLHCHCI